MTIRKRDSGLMKPAKPTVALPLLEDLRRLIEETRQGVAATVNAALSLLYWRVGKRINEEILKGERAEYGQQILATLSQELVRDYGNGFGEKNMRRMIQFAEVFPDERIVVSLIRQLTWTHFIALIPLKDKLKRDFYTEMCRIERWSVRTLRRLVAIELKLGRFKADYKGQMELYLRWLDKYERRLGEAHPLGLILCADKSDEHIALLELSKSGIRVAQYFTQLPPRKILEEKLHEAIRRARRRLTDRKLS